MKTGLLVAFLICTLCQASLAAPQVQLELTYPAGKSPKVFTSGWLFGAKCTVTDAKGIKKDVSGQVVWSGTGTFTPKVGSPVRPKFRGPGANEIKLTYGTGKSAVSKTYRITAVDPAKYARVGDGSLCRADSHGCPACPHVTSGPITTGSPQVLIDGKPAARVGDTGINVVPCCGANTFKLTHGDPQVLINGRPAVKIGDKTQHCGGEGTVIDASAATIAPNTAADGTYSGSFTGDAGGAVKLTIKGTSVTGSFSGKHIVEGGGSATLALSGDYNPKTGGIMARMSGKAGYTYEGKKHTATVTGILTGTLAKSVIKGTWQAEGKGMYTATTEGRFQAARAQK